MKKLITAFLLGLLLTIVSLPASAALTIDAALEVRDDETVRPVDYLLLGAGSEWGTDGGFSVFPQSTELSAQYLAVAEKIHRMPLARTAGASMNYFFWENSVGPYSQRKLAGKGIWSFTGPTNYGPVEWVKSNLAIDPECQFIIGLNLLTESAEENAEYAEFMTADAKTSELGARRAAYGLTEPVRAAAFELGNELDWGDISLTAEEYCRRAKQTIRAVRERVPDAKFLACGKTYPYEEGLESMSWRAWNRTVLAELGGEIDYLSHHCYYDGQPLAKTEQYLDVMARDIRELTGSNRIRIAFTEQARWPSNNASGDAAESDSNALTGVLSTADFLNRMYNRTDAWSANYFMFPGALEGYWGMAGPGRNEKKWYLSGVTQLYNLYGDELGSQVVRSELSGSSSYVKPDNNSCQLTALATADGSRLKLALTNKSSLVDFRVSLSFSHPYRLVSRTVFTAPDSLSKVTGADTESIFTAEKEELSVEEISQVTAPRQSVTFLTLERTDGTSVPDNEGARAAAETVNQAIRSEDISGISSALVLAGETVKELAGIPPAELAGTELASRMLSYQAFSGPAALAAAVRGELAAMRIADAASAAEVKEILTAENEAFRCNLSSAAALSAGDRPYQSLAGKDYASVESVRRAFEEAVVLDRVQHAVGAAEMKQLIDESIDLTGCDKARYYALTDKAGLGNSLLSQTALFQTLADVGAAIDQYLPAQNTAVVFEDGFDSLPVMDGYQKGKGKKIGTDWRVSWITNSWNNGVYTKIEADTQNAGNRMLKVKGVGTDFPLAVDLAGDLSALKADQRISVDFMKTGGGAISCGLRFQSHSHGMDYYEVTFPTWWYKPKFRKVVNDTETVNLPFGSDGQIDSEHWFTLTVTTLGNTVSYRVDRKGGSMVCEGSYTDPEPFGQSGGNAGIQLIMLGDAGEVCFDNVRVQNVEPFSDGTEPPRMLYLNTSLRRRILTPNQPDAGLAVDGDPETAFSGSASLTLDMRGEYPVRRVRMERLSIGGTMGVYASRDRKSWTRLDTIGPDSAAQGQYELLNFSDTTPYRYLKLQPTGGYSIGELTVLTDAAGKALPVRMGGALYFELHDTTGQGASLSATGAATVDGSRVSPDREGTFSVVMSAGDQILTASVSALPPCGTVSSSASEAVVCVGCGYSEGLFAAFYDKDGLFLKAAHPDLVGVNVNQDEPEYTVSIPRQSMRGVIYSWREALQPQMPGYEFWTLGNSSENAG